jgi:predicted nucleic acid-binding protein
MADKLLYDTSIYVEILRSRVFAATVRGEYERRVPSTYFSSVVVQELLAGARDQGERRIVEELYVPFERARRIVTPTHGVWKEAGLLLRKVLDRLADGKTLLRTGLINDVLIALSARGIGAAVVTKNREDFALIQRFAPVEVLCL